MFLTKEGDIDSIKKEQGKYPPGYFYCRDASGMHVLDWAIRLNQQNVLDVAYAIQRATGVGYFE